MGPRTDPPPLRVLSVYQKYFPGEPGGVQEAIRHIAFATRDQGEPKIETRIFTLSRTPEPAVEARPEGTVLRMRALGTVASCEWGGLGVFRHFARAAAWADVLHFHYPWPFGDLVHWAMRSRTPAMLTYHSDVIRQRGLDRLYAPLRGRMLRSMRAIVATSPGYPTGSPVLTDPALEGRVRMIPLGMDERILAQDEDPSILGRIGLSPEVPFFLFVGALRYYKGLHTLIEAAALVPEAQVVIAGSGYEEASLHAQLRAAQLPHVQAIGGVTEPEKLALLRRARALVLPSHLRSEAFGMILIEAARAGTPMITCEIGTGTSFVNADGETGIVVPPESPERFAQAMRILLSQPSTAETMGQKARARYETLFSGQALGKAYAACYRSVAEGR